MKINYYKGVVGDNINVTLAAAAFNFKKYMNKLKNWLFFQLEQLLALAEKMLLNYFGEVKGAKKVF